MKRKSVEQLLIPTAYNLLSIIPMAVLYPDTYISPRNVILDQGTFNDEEMKTPDGNGMPFQGANDHSVSAVPQPTRLMKFFISTPSKRTRRTLLYGDTSLTRTEDTGQCPGMNGLPMQ